jgi:signal recognition particle GTPase
MIHYKIYTSPVKLKMALDNEGTVEDTLNNAKPTVILTIGMAGSGKTTFMQVNYHKIHFRKFNDLIFRD